MSYEHIHQLQRIKDKDILLEAVKGEMEHSNITWGKHSLVSVKKPLKFPYKMRILVPIPEEYSYKTPVGQQ